MIDIGVDFAVNNRPPRHVILTDWEARLVEHCLGRYVEVAATIEGEPTLPLAVSALGKVARGPIPAAVSSNARASLRRRESRLVRELIDPSVTAGHLEQKWGELAQQLAEALAAVDPSALAGIRLARGGEDEGITAADWLQFRLAKAERASA